MLRLFVALFVALVFAASGWVFYAPSKQAVAIAHGVPCAVHDVQHYPGDHLVSILDCFGEIRTMVERPREPSWRDWVLPNLLATGVDVH